MCSFRIDGSVPAAAALLASEGLRDDVGIVARSGDEPRHGRRPGHASICRSGTTLPKNAATYTVTADLTNFAADKMLLGQKVEASRCRVSASTDGYQIKGDVKINGTPATIDLAREKARADAELQLQATIDEAARRRLGIDFGSAVTGTIPVKVVGRVGDNDKDDA